MEGSTYIAVRIVSANIVVKGPMNNTDEQGQEANDIFWANTSKVEDMLNELLPEGYYVKVTE